MQNRGGAVSTKEKDQLKKEHNEKMNHYNQMFVNILPRRETSVQVGTDNNNKAALTIMILVIRGRNFEAFFCGI